MPKNRLYIKHPETVDFPATEFSADISAGATTGSVLNNSDFASNNLILINSYGNEKAEIVTCSGVSGATGISFSAAKFDHTKGTILTRVEYNQYVLERCGTETGTYAAINTASLSIDETENMYVDNTTESNAWYKYRYYDTSLTTYSDYSDVFQIDYKENSLYELRKIIEILSGIPSKEDEIDRLLNWYQRKICSQYNYPFMETTTTTSSVANQVKYDLPSDCKILKSIRVTKGSAYYWPTWIPFNEFKLAQLNTSAATIPSYWTKVGTQYWFHNPFSSLGTDNITVFYSKFPARLDSDNDVTPLPLADALVNKVASVIVRPVNPEKAQSLMSDYIGALNELKAIYGVSQMESFPQVDYGEVTIEEILEIDTT